MTGKNKAPLEGRAGPKLQSLLTARRNNNEREEEEGEALSCRRAGIYGRGADLSTGTAE
jgi:hypothetical protein